MTTQIGDESMIIPRELHQLVRAGEIRGVSAVPDGVVYLVRWSDTGQESLLRPGLDSPLRGGRSRCRGVGLARLTR